MLASVFCLTKVFYAQEGRPVLRWWLAAGAACGLALLSKYNALFLPLGVGLYLLTRRDRKRLLLSVGPWASLLLIVVLFSPVILWNMSHEWVSFSFQGGRGLPGVALHPLKLLQTIGGQALYLAPWIWVPLLAELFICLFWLPPQDRKRFLAIIAVGPIIVFTIVSLWAAGQVLPHWAMPGYLMLFPLVGVRIVNRLRERRQYIRFWLTGSAIAMGIFAIVLASHAATGWGRNVIPSLARKDPTVEMVDWRQLPEAFAARGLIRPEKVFVVTGRWLDAAKVDYSLGGRLPVICLSQDPRHFAFLHDPSSFTGWDAVIVAPRVTEEIIQQIYGSCFGSIEPLGDVVIRQSASIALTLKLFLGHDFRAVYKLPYPSMAATSR
jgi:4-amino-4-deoxy-L-arabinose transferase-like glycosyltransferase